MLRGVALEVQRDAARCKACYAAAVASLLRAGDCDASDAADYSSSDDEDTPYTSSTAWDCAEAFLHLGVALSREEDTGLVCERQLSRARSLVPTRRPNSISRRDVQICEVSRRRGARAARPARDSSRCRRTTVSIYTFFFRVMYVSRNLLGLWRGPTMKRVSRGSPEHSLRILTPDPCSYPTLKHQGKILWVGGPGRAAVGPRPTRARAPATARRAARARARGRTATRGPHGLAAHHDEACDCGEFGSVGVLRVVGTDSYEALSLSLSRSHPNLEVSWNLSHDEKTRMDRLRTQATWGAWPRRPRPRAACAAARSPSSASASCSAAPSAAPRTRSARRSRSSPTASAPDSTSPTPSSSRDPRL